MARFGSGLAVTGLFGTAVGVLALLTAQASHAPHARRPPAVQQAVQRGGRAPDGAGGGSASTDTPSAGAPLTPYDPDSATDQVAPWAEPTTRARTSEPGRPG
ncbi:hypothetical protein [Actinacidiphila yeochonensis]|uniref:hypothetical protein n=1 Tax=Actinacidiphila yeochonensis TaxID=89050 RepID=UPI00055B9A97|nr:hypothetical protein [Actinacidiphila yeochonensis]